MKVMKKLLCLLCLAAMLTLSLASCAPSDAEPMEKVTLYVYNWGEYISDGTEDSLDTNQMFEEWCRTEKGVDVTVNYSTYSSNESMYAKLSSGSVKYDVIVPSDYMIERMIKEDMLAPLNLDNFENLGNLHPDFFGEDAKYDSYEIDPNNCYSIPYMYGTRG